MNCKAALAMAMVAWATAVAAEPIKLIVPTAPGGGTDGFFRVVAKEAAPYFTDPIIVVNVPGAGGTIGVAQMVNAQPDGHTLAAVWLGPVTVSPHTMKVPYTPDRLHSGDPGVERAVRGLRAPRFPGQRRQGPHRRAARKNPDKYTYGNDGLGGPGHLGTARILNATGGRRATCRSRAPARRCTASSAGTSTSTWARSRRSCRTCSPARRSACS